MIDERGTFINHARRDGPEYIGVSGYETYSDPVSGHFFITEEGWSGSYDPKVKTTHVAVNVFSYEGPGEIIVGDRRSAQIHVPVVGFKRINMSEWWN